MTDRGNFLSNGQSLSLLATLLTALRCQYGLWFHTTFIITALTPGLQSYSAGGHDYYPFRNRQRSRARRCAIASAGRANCSGPAPVTVGLASLPVNPFLSQRR